MALQTPGTDPLFAWDIPGWTNQGATAPKGPDTLEGLPGNTTTQLNQVGSIGSPGSAGLMAWTMDPAAAASTTSALSSGIYGLVQVPVETTVDHVYIWQVAASGAHMYVVLSDLFGNVIAATADQTTGTVQGKVALAAATTIGPGFYYLGAQSSGSSTFFGMTANQVTMISGAVTYSATAPYAFPRFVTATGAAGASAPTALTFTSAATIGAPFVGLGV
jgi:hypothetical protein